MEQRSAFDRAWDVLENHPGVVWTARLSAIAAGLLTAALLCVMALFVDLLITQGRVPSFAELSGPNRQRFLTAATEFNGERRSQGLAAIGISSDGAKPLEAPVDQLPAIGRELVWRAHVWDILDTRVNPEAAETYAAAVKELDPAVAQSVSGLGLLSLIVRTDGQFVQPVLGWFARWNGW